MNRNQRGPANGLDQARNTATPSWAQPAQTQGEEGKGGGKVRGRATPGKKTKADYERERKRTPLRVGKRTNNGGVEGRMSRRGSLKKRNRRTSEEKARDRMEANKVVVPDVPKVRGTKRRLYRRTAGPKRQQMRHAAYSHKLTPPYSSLRSSPSS